MGPAKAELGKVAVVDIPEDYRFLDAKNARMLLQSMKNPIPRGLAGILFPPAGKWWALVEYQEPGYIKTEKDSTIDAAAVLAIVQERLKGQNVERARMALAPITEVSWETQPTFDSEHGTVEWSYRAETVTGSVVNHTIRMLGRRGYLDITAVRSPQATDEAVPLKDLMSNISFVEGERYTDFIRGDDIAKMSLTELITYDGKPIQQVSMFARAGFWAGAIAAVVLAAGVAALLIVRKAKRQKAHAGSTNGHRVNGYHRHNEVSLWQALTGHRGVRGPHSKRIFNHHKYYSDLMSQVSYGSYGSAPFVNRTKQAAAEPADSESRNGHSNHHVQASQMPLFNSTEIVGELIANQKALIEEQKRLLQQQTKLIEEKTRLIEEKSKMLERQSELIGSNLL